MRTDGHFSKDRSNGMPSFYEFFAGGGMVRTGLGKGWDCLLANDIDERKGASYAANFGSERLKVKSVGELTTSEAPVLPYARTFFTF